MPDLLGAIVGLASCAALYYAWRFADGYDSMPMDIGSDQPALLGWLGQDLTDCYERKSARANVVPLKKPRASWKTTNVPAAGRSTPAFT